jgi:hypothetical protein
MSFASIFGGAILVENIQTLGEVLHRASNEAFRHNAELPDSTQAMIMDWMAGGDLTSVPTSYLQDLNAWFIDVTGDVDFMVLGLMEGYEV